MRATRHSLSRIGCATIVWLYVLTLVSWLALRPGSGDSLWWLAVFNIFAPFLFAPLVPAAIGVWLAGSRLSRIGWLLSFAILVVWLGPTYLPKLAPVSGNARPQIRVMTLNTYVDSLIAEPLLTSIRFESPDVVVLQELNELNATALTELKTTFPYHSLMPLQGDEGGLGVLSKFSFQDHSWLTLANQLTDAQWVTLDVNGRSIDLLNAHLVNNRLSVFNDESRARFDAANRTREQQAREIGAFVREHPNSIVAGDLNTTDTTMPHEILQGELKDSYREMGSGPGATFSSEWFWYGPIPVPPRLLRLDYILHTRSIVTMEAHVGASDSQSDHLPVIATLFVK